MSCAPTRREPHPPDIVLPRRGSLVWLPNLVGSFGEAITIVEVSTVAYDVEDVDLDGDVDVVAMDYYRRVLWIAFNNGDATFAIASRTLPAVGPGPDCMDLADLDQDGLPEVVLGTQRGVFVLPGRGQGFDPAIRIHEARRKCVQVADGDSDGRPDVLVSGSSFDESSAIFWLQNRGRLRFDRVASVVPEPCISECTARAVDSDGDSWLDVIGTVRTEPGSGLLWRNLGRMQFDEGQQFVGGDSNNAPVWCLDGADVDGRGAPDLLANDGVERIDESLGWYPGGAGTLERLPIAHVKCKHLATQDLDADGDIDAVIIHGWETPETTSVAYNPVGDDRDADRLPDLVEECIVGTDPRVADTDGDGVLDYTELWALSDPRISDAP